MEATCIVTGHKIGQHPRMNPQ